MTRFHYLARGVIMMDDKVLVAKGINAENTFLPGGHIEMGEKATDALQREMTEEIGHSATVSTFLGAIEHTWGDEEQMNHEINLLFKVEINGLTTAQAPQSQEPHLQFLWLGLDQLTQYDLRPEPVIELIKGIGSNTVGYWGSTL
ncbi:MAG: NUDIX domain-containing protein [Algicola sp.]|nr:NUDIX domain-containing protein [Algicola sp.]